MIRPINPQSLSSSQARSIRVAQSLGWVVPERIHPSRAAVRGDALVDLQLICGAGPKPDRCAEGIAHSYQVEAPEPLRERVDGHQRVLEFAATTIVGAVAPPGPAEVQAQDSVPPNIG